MKKYIFMVLIVAVVIGIETYLRYQDYQLIRSQVQTIDLFSDRIERLEQLIDHKRISSHPDSRKEQLLSNEMAQLQSKTDRLSKQLEVLSSASEAVKQNQEKAEQRTVSSLPYDDIKSAVAEVLNEMAMHQQVTINAYDDQSETQATSGQHLPGDQQSQSEHLANSLSLNETQVLAYQRMLQEYQDILHSSSTLMNSDQYIDGADDETIQAHFEDQLLQEAELVKDFNEDFLALLDEQQIALFQKLPPDEKAVLGQRTMSKSDFSYKK